jgi:thermostable 8-oxoguanine DNA glycosylase
MKAKKIVMIFCVLLALISVSAGVPAQETANKEVTADVDCNELGRLNGEVGYQYDVTLKNNTASKLIVEYTVIFMEGTARKKEHKHSTLMIPKESLVETHEGKIKETDWDKVTSFRIEWSWRVADEMRTRRDR